MFRTALLVWLLSQTIISAEALSFTEAEKNLVNSTASLTSLPESLKQRVANNTLAWMTETSGHVLDCWREQTPEGCSAALGALTADRGPALKTADMEPAVSRFQRASRAAVQSAIRALADGRNDAAISQFNAYCRMLESGDLPVRMLEALSPPSGARSGWRA